MEYIGLLGRRTSLVEVATAVIVFIFAAYLLVIYSTYQALKLRDYALTGDPDLLQRHDLYNPPEETKKTLIDAMVKSFNHNIPVLKQKATWTGRAIMAIGLEAALALVVGLVLLWMA